MRMPGASRQAWRPTTGTADELLDFVCLVKPVVCDMACAHPAGSVIAFQKIALSSVQAMGHQFITFCEAGSITLSTVIFKRSKFVSNNELFKLMPIVQAYFEGERREMLLILLASAFGVFTAAAIYSSARDGFSKAMLVTVALSAILLSGTALSLMVRDPKLSKDLIAAIQSERALPALRAEQTRVADIVGKYVNYRLVAAALGLVALLLLALTHQPWMHGVATGLLLLVATQTIIDRYSEQRAKDYLSRLNVVAL
jgi:hypothetical protein